MNYLDILILDDDSAMIDMFDTTVEEWNANNKEQGKQLNVIHAESLLRAHQSRFDAAIVDLRLPDKNNEGSSADNGNDFAASMVNSRGIPVAVVSGHVVELSAELEKLEHFRKFSKSHGYGPVVDWLSDQWDLMTTLRKSREQIEAASAEVFSKRLWPQWQNTPALSGSSPERQAKIVTRQFASHISDLLGLDTDQNPDWHPYENYIVPALTSERTHTGDLFNLTDDIWIVLSPQCDMANANVPNVLLAKCTIGHKDWTTHIDHLKVTPDRDRSRKVIKKFVDQDFSKSKHFLPPLPGENEPLLVDFSVIQTKPLEELNKILDHRLGSVSTPFLSNLIQRFGAFVSRTGQPNIDIVHFFES
ncbi:response regulator [Roseobacter sp. N2S]|uniref:response regulator n=1 Tax=Roseobacter sp. N2S TaxID=2663844 RepID=UPI00285D103F|nr:response regulator [Roseobacter sp. N2S]MDR6266597.1 CheY-like chemotaxis protein [Roseobacter sp. N2S]